MCGILGIASSVRSGTPGKGGGPLDDADLMRLRDLMTHRGPDSAGLWRGGHVALAHRRLAIIDPTPAGHQPMFTPDGRFVLVYNGEIYNDRDLRVELASVGVTFESTCDAETVLHAWATWGRDTLSKLRGMFALAIYDTHNHRLFLARDPLGIKPLFFARLTSAQQSLIFASEIMPILRHPDMPIQPDLAGVSAYITTIHQQLDRRTLFEGIHTVRPGECIEVDCTRLERGDSALHYSTYWNSVPVASQTEQVIDELRTCVMDAVRLHLRSDVPACLLLSGGLDSGAITSTTVAQPRDLAACGAGWRDDRVRTYCAGAVGDFRSDDFTFAARLSDVLGTHHEEVHIDGDTFVERWQEIVDRTGQPMSTPNEVAIYEVSRRLRADGHAVALSGEGADELFGGYDLPLTDAARFHGMIGPPGARPLGTEHAHAGHAHLEAISWVPVNGKHAVMNDAFVRDASEDQRLISHYRDLHDHMTASAGPNASPLDPHLRMLRRTNLLGLLRRLDSSTMLASVEGRVPYCDAMVANAAESLPMELKFILPAEGELRPARTKVALRRAFASDLPGWVVDRPKASFPLPFQHWLDRVTDTVRGAPTLREWFRSDIVDHVVADPEHHWMLAWPMYNLGLWARRWWDAR